MAQGGDVHRPVGEGVEEARPAPPKGGRQTEAHETGDPVTGQDGIEEIVDGIAAQPECLIQFGTNVRQRDLRGRHSPHSIPASAHFRRHAPRLSKLKLERPAIGIT